MRPAIRIENIGKRYHLGRGGGAAYRTFREALVDAATAPFRRRRATDDDFWALRDVSFDVRPGEVVGVIGRNGAGKSTLLKVLSRITRPSVGRVEIEGRVGSLLEVGTGFHPELTGRENVFLNGSFLGMGRREVARKFDEIVGFAEVERFLDTPVKRYSSGMYVRLAFAVAAHLEPEVLIVDEVLAVGDAAFQKKCLDKMGEVGREGRTVVVVSHDMAAVAALCTRGVLLKGGQVAAEGNIRDVAAAYLADGIASADGRYDLRDHPARAVAMRPVIEAVTLRDADGRPTNRFASRAPLTVELDLHSRTRIADARIAVAVEDSFGRRLFTVANYLTAAGPCPLFGRATARCVVPDLRLGTGRYLLSVSVSGGTDRLVDSIDGCGWFTVEAQNCYGRAEKYIPVYGPVLEDSNWTLETAR